MNAMELLTTRRTYRRFAQKAVPQDEIGRASCRERV